MTMKDINVFRYPFWEIMEVLAIRTPKKKRTIIKIKRKILNSVYPAPFFVFLNVELVTSRRRRMPDASVVEPVHAYAPFFPHPQQVT